MKPLRVMWFVPTPSLVLAASRAPDVVAGQFNKSSDEQFDALASGAVDAVVTAMDNVFAWNRRAGPADLAIVAQVEKTTPLSLVGSNAGDLAALRGATILVDAPGNGFVIALCAMLAEAGIGPEAYTLREAGGVKARFDALQAGEGDATLLGPPFDRMAIAAGRTLLARVQEAYPRFPGQGLVARRSVLQAKAPQFHALLQAMRGAAQESVADPSGSRKHLVDAGFAPDAAEAQLHNLPVNLIPEREGIELLIGHRQQLGLPGAEDTYEALVDLATLDNLEEK